MSSKKFEFSRKVGGWAKDIVPSQQLTQLGGQANNDYVLGVSQSKIVRINSATVEQLDKLSGIGPAIAKRIINYRTKNGGFKNIEELKLVSGIGDKLYEEIKNDVAL